MWKGIILELKKKLKKKNPTNSAKKTKFRLTYMSKCGCQGNVKWGERTVDRNISVRNEQPATENF